MAAPKKAKTTGKKAVAASASLRKKSGGKKTASSKKPAPKTAGGSRTAPAKKKVVAKKTAVKKTAVRKPAAKKTAGRKAGEKAARRKFDRLEELKKVLLGKRETIVREAKAEISKYISGENRQLVDTALDEGDWAVVDISEDINLRRLDAHRKALHDIDESLRKIKEGTYGICEECGEEISEKRLRILPAANLCVACQENKEQLEAMEKTETF
jgi:DnaK suppressor protein